MYTTSLANHNRQKGTKQQKTFIMTYVPVKQKGRTTCGTSWTLAEPGLWINPFLQIKARENHGPKTSPLSELFQNCDIESCISATYTFWKFHNLQWKDDFTPRKSTLHDKTTTVSPLESQTRITIFFGCACLPFSSPPVCPNNLPQTPSSPPHSDSPAAHWQIDIYTYLDKMRRKASPHAGPLVSCLPTSMGSLIRWWFSFLEGSFLNYHADRNRL